MTTIAAQPSFLLPAASLCRRELIRFIRQPNRIVGALATPLVFWLLIGGGMGNSLHVDPAGQVHTSYIHYFLPGTIVLILLFTAIFSTISIIEDRREGFLQSVLVAPVSRMSIVLGKIMGGALLATGQGVLLLAAAPLVGFHFTVLSFLLCLFILFVLSFALTALGFWLAWRMTSTQGFHAIMNLFLMPMWFLSGALFPPSGAWPGLRYVMAVNPLTYGLDALRRAMDLPSASYASLPGPGLGVSLLVSIAFAAFVYLIASLIASRPSAADLQ